VITLHIPDYFIVKVQGGWPAKLVTPSFVLQIGALHKLNIFLSIKKDATLFPTLKDDHYHDGWHRSFKTQAVAQDVSEVLDESYTPSTPDDIALFNENRSSFIPLSKVKC
jgi:hypothetical protein